MRATPSPSDARAAVPGGAPHTRMTFDDELDRALATLTARLRSEVERLTRETSASLIAAARADRDRAAAQTRSEAEASARTQLASAGADADQRLREAEERAREEGRQIGIEQGRFEGI